MTYRISVDTGGTFTDIVVSDESGRLELGKAPTTRARAYEGLREGIGQVAERLGLSVEELLAQTEVLTYGTTRATNAIVEGKTARTAFFTTEGFPDILLVREGGKPDPFKQIPYPAAVRPALAHVRDPRAHGLRRRAVPRARRGLRAWTRSAARASCAPRRSRSACSGRSSTGAHEQRVGELIEEHLPGVPYTLSHALNPIIREYRRASSTAIDASLKPLMQEYLSTMESDLRAAGFAGHLLIATSFGGAWRPDQVVERPIYSVGSGPSLAPVAALDVRAGRVRRGGGRQPRRLRHRRHDVRRRAHLGRSRQRDGRDVARRALDGAHHGHPLGRRQVDRLGRRLDHLDRSGRAAARRPAERGRRPRPCLLPARRHGADRHGRRGRARLDRPRLLPRRPADARRRRLAQRPAEDRASRSG